MTPDALPSDVSAPVSDAADVSELSTPPLVDAPTADVPDATLTKPAVWSIAWRGVVDEARVAVTPSGNIVVAGGFGVGALQTGAPGPAPFAAGSEDWFIAELPPSGGAPYWIRQVSSDSYDTAESVAVAADGSIYVAGQTSGPVDYHGMPGAPAGSDNPRLGLLKLDSTGAFVWAYSMLDAVAVSPAPNGDVFLGGSQFGDGSVLTATVTRFDAAGDVTAQRSFGSQTSETSVLDLATDSTGAPVVELRSNGSVNFGSGFQDGNITVKLDRDLNPVWSKACGVSSGALPMELAVAPNDDIVVGGNGVADCAGATASSTTPGFFVLYDPSGNLIASHSYQGSPNVSDVAFDSTQRVYVAGNTVQSFSVPSGLYVGGTDFSGGSPFAWIAPQSGVTTNKFFPPAIASIAPGRVIVAAVTRGKVDLGNGTLLSLGGNGLVLAEIAP